MNVLSHSYELDDAPDYEQFFFVTASQPFAVEDVRRAAFKLVPVAGTMAVRLELPEQLEQTTLLIIKDKDVP